MHQQFTTIRIYQFCEGIFIPRSRRFQGFYLFFSFNGFHHSPVLLPLTLFISKPFHLLCQPGLKYLAWIVDSIL